MKTVLHSIIICLVACHADNRQLSNPTVDSFPQTDTSIIQKQDSIIPALLKVSLPMQKRTIQEINEIVSGIDKYIKKNECKTETVYGFNDEPCEIVRYLKNDTLIQIERGFGDCSIVMSSEKYYFKDNSLIYLQKHIINYGYPPCMSEEECKENSVTEKFKKEHRKERTETYSFLDPTDYSFKRTGNFNDTGYVQNDTLSGETILKNAIDYLNAQEPK